MTLLDTAIDRYFSATNARNNQLAAECFDPDASVFDEGQQLTGLESIQHWLQQSQQKYQPLVQVLTAEHNYGEVWVKAKVSGQFQGSIRPMSVKSNAGDQHDHSNHTRHY